MRAPAPDPNYLRAKMRSKPTFRSLTRSCPTRKENMEEQAYYHPSRKRQVSQTNETKSPDIVGAFNFLCKKSYFLFYLRKGLLGDSGSFFAAFFYFSIHI